MPASRPADGSDLRSRVLCAGVAAALVQLVQSSFALGHAPLPTEDFLSHALMILAFHLVAAVSLGWLSGGVLWSAVVFLFPVSTALDLVRAPVLWIFLLAVLGIMVLAYPRGARAAVIAAVAGAAAGTGILALRIGSDGLAMLPLALVSLALCAAWAGARWASGRSGPRPIPALLAAGAAWGLAAVASLLLGGARLHPPSDVTRGAGAPAPVILIVLDTLRLDHLSIFGYARNSAPRLARFASEPNVIAARSVANGPSSLPSHASMLTGLFPIRHGAHKPLLSDRSPPLHAYPLRESIPTLAALLSEAGYWTVGVSSNAGPLGPAFGLGRGFHVYDAVQAPQSLLRMQSPWVPKGWARSLALRPWRALYGSGLFPSSELLGGVVYRRADVISDLAIEVVDRTDDRALFLFLNYFDPHHPYSPRRGFARRFPGRAAGLPLTGLPPRTVRSVNRGERSLTQRERDHVVSLYDTEVAYLDQELGRLLERLRAHPRYPDMLILITSDHGEAFGEHQHVGHSTSLYREIVDVPLIVKFPARFRAEAKALRSGLFQSADVFPTVLEHASLPIPEGIDGRAWARGRSHAYSWLFPHPGFVRMQPERFEEELQSVENADWKLVRSSRGGIELFDRGASAEESLSVAAQHPDRVRELSDLLDAQEARKAAPQPAGEEVSSPEVRERLRALGYIE